MGRVGDGSFMLAHISNEVLPLAEPALPGQKSWKRPASAADTERRLAESRRAAALVQTPSDGEKDRR